MDYKEIVNEKRKEMIATLIRSMKNNPKRWEKGWSGFELPFNGKTQANYRQLNALYLMLVAEEKGYKDPRWVTFNQAKDLKASIRAGEKSSSIFFWSMYDKATKKDFDKKTVENMTRKERAEYEEKNVRPVMKFYSVFNAEQCVSFPEREKPSIELNKQNGVIEEIIRKSPVPIFYDTKDRAYYSFLKDEIHLPSLDQFKSSGDYYATALHEMAHATGHETRLKRPLTGDKQSEAYAIEELRAELASVFLQTDFGFHINGAHFENHGAYLHAWLKAIEKDPTLLYSIASDAEKITDYIVKNTNAKSIIEAETATEEKKSTLEPQIEEKAKTEDANVRTPFKPEEANGTAPTVRIEWSEYRELDELKGREISLFEADWLIQYLYSSEKLQKEAMGGYFKTKFVISYGKVKEDGKRDEYVGRVDSDEKCGIIEHIRSEADYTKQHFDEIYPNHTPELAKIKKEAREANDFVIKSFVPYLLKWNEYEREHKKKDEKAEQTIDKMSDNVVISSEVLATRQEMLNIVWSGYGNDYYAVSNEKILIPDEDDERDNGFIEVDGQAVYVIDKYGSIQQNQVGQKLTSYDININLPYYSQRDYKQIPLEDLQRIADERAAKITAYAQALKEVERKSEKPVHNDLYFLKIAKQELDNQYADFHSVEPFYGKYMRTQVDNPEAIVMRRLGDFYEVMGDKAAQVAAALDLTLTGRDVGLNERVAMCGFPYHVADEYIAKLRENSDVIVDDKYLVKRRADSKDNANNENSVKGEKRFKIKSQVENWEDWYTDSIKNKRAREAAEWLIENNYENEDDVKSVFYDRQTSSMSDDPDAEKNDEKAIIRVANEYKTRQVQEQEMLEEARKAAHDAELPFSDKFDIGEEVFNPNVYDGSMSIEDYNLMNEMIASEQAEKVENTKKSNLYYPINDDAARRAKQANSFDDYINGSATKEYRQNVDKAKEIADFQKTQVDPIYYEKIDHALDTYARKLAQNMNKRFEIDSRVPSVMVVGAGNFPIRQKEKQNIAREKNWEEWKDISEIPDKIRTIGMGGIQSSEPNALEKLEQKVAELEKSQETMKQVNAYYRKNKTLDDCPYLSNEQLDELKAEMTKSWHGTVPFQSFALSNNNAEIKRIKSRIEDLKKAKDGHFVGWKFFGGKVEANSKEMRLQIFFDEKPDAIKREELKKAGFRWSPIVGSWQRQLNNNAIYAADGVKFIQPMNGESPSNLQRRVRAEQESADKTSAARMLTVKLKKEDKNWLYETVRIDLLNDEENATTNEYIKQLNFSENELRMSEQAQHTDTVEPVKQVGQSQQVEKTEQVEQVEKTEIWGIDVPSEQVGKLYGNLLLIKMPKDGQFSNFVFFAPEKYVKHDRTNGTVRLEMRDGLVFNLVNDGKIVEVTSQELRAVMERKEISKSAQESRQEKKNSERIDDLQKNIPEEMRNIPNWCVYRTKWDEEKGKKSKYILSPITGKWASTKDPGTWTDFDSAVSYAKENRCSGVAFALGGGISCIDLDKCFNEKDEMSALAKRLTTELAGTYIERSVSGNGLHIFVKDDLLAKSKYRNRAETPDGELEVYSSGRFMSMTGDVFGEKHDLTQSSVETTSWIRQTLGRRETFEHVEKNEAQNMSQSDCQVIERIRSSKKSSQFDTLYNGGDITGDKSRDDLAMLNILAFFTDCNQSQMESIFMSSGRFRPDKKSTDYLKRSIGLACSSLRCRIGQGATRNGAQKGKG